MTHDTLLTDPHLAAAFRTDTTEDASARWLAPHGDVPLPDVWMPEFVGVRLVEGYRILFRLPRDRFGPKGFGSAMPAYVHEGPERKRVWNERKSRYELAWVLPDPDHAGHVDQTAVPRETVAAPTSAEMARMDAILAWPRRFLAHDAELAACASNWAMWEAREQDIDLMADQFFWAKTKAFQAKRREGLRLIARGLNAAGEGVV